jgi:hypothetical protein
MTDQTLMLYRDPNAEPSPDDTVEDAPAVQLGVDLGSGKDGTTAILNDGSSVYVLDDDGSNLCPTDKAVNAAYNLGGYEAALALIEEQNGSKDFTLAHVALATKHLADSNPPKWDEAVFAVPVDPDSFVHTVQPRLEELDSDALEEDDEP